MTTGMFLWMCGAILALFVIGYAVDYFLEESRGTETVNTNIDFTAMVAQHRRELPADVDMDDTGVIKIMDMRSLIAKQDADIGQEFVDSLKKRLILAGAYS